MSCIGSSVECVAVLPLLLNLLSLTRAGELGSMRQRQVPLQGKPTGVPAPRLHPASPVLQHSHSL
jgi:hypothetical protein